MSHKHCPLKTISFNGKIASLVSNLSYRQIYLHQYFNKHVKLYIRVFSQTSLNQNILQIKVVTYASQIRKMHSGSNEQILLEKVVRCASVMKIITTGPQVDPQSSPGGAPGMYFLVTLNRSAQHVWGTSTM